MTNKRPNVLIIMSDQHHAGVMGCAGDPVVSTPALDGLAARGVMFGNTYCPYPLCGPSRMSFMTGRHPHEIGVWDNLRELSSAVPTFAHGFVAGGYETVLSGRMHFVGADQRHGFMKRIISDVPGTAYISTGWKLEDVLGDLKNTTGMSLAGINKSGPGRTGYHAYDEAVTRKSVEWIKQRGEAGGGTPFMLTVGYVSPHCPFVAPEGDFERYAGVIRKKDLPDFGGSVHPVTQKCRKDYQTDPAPGLDAQWRARVAYYGLCTFIDRQVGEVLEALEASGLAEDTVVVYTSDHGEMLGEHGMWWKGTFYDGAGRVPMIVSYPRGFEGGRRVDRNVSLMDIGETMLDVCGLEGVPGASGKSFKELLHGRDGAWDDTVYSELIWGGGKGCARMVRSGEWKYNFYSGERAELFNMRRDPGEVNDLAGDPAFGEVCGRLRGLALKGYDPERVIAGAKLAHLEQKLIAGWVRASRPAEPDAIWFDGPEENRWDMSRTMPQG